MFMVHLIGTRGKKIQIQYELHLTVRYFCTFYKLKNVCTINKLQITFALYDYFIILCQS